MSPAPCGRPESSIRPAAAEENPLTPLLVAFLCAFGVDAEHPCAAPDAAFQIGEQPFVGKVERVRMLPVVSSDFLEPTNHLVVAYFDRQLAPVVEAAGGEVDRADNRGDPVREEHFPVELEVFELMDLDAHVKLDGLLPWLAHFYFPDLVGFGPDYPNMIGLTWDGRVLDRRLLVDLERPVWDSIAGACSSG
jgi:hypothetical protein